MDDHLRFVKLAFSTFDCCCCLFSWVSSEFPPSLLLCTFQYDVTECGSGGLTDHEENGQHQVGGFLLLGCGTQFGSVCQTQVSNVADGDSKKKNAAGKHEVRVEKNVGVPSFRRDIHAHEEWYQSWQGSRNGSVQSWAIWQTFLTFILAISPLIELIKKTLEEQYFSFGFIFFLVRRILHKTRFWFLSFTSWYSIKRKTQKLGRALQGLHNRDGLLISFS